MSVQNLRRVYVWQLPVRVFHWLNALCIIVLCGTGYLIANPPAIQSSEEASFRYFFGAIRFIHFATAYIFVFNYLFRVYWALKGGNKYANWKVFVPTKMAYLKNMWHVLVVDILLIKQREVLSVGHNSLAAFSYLIIFLAFLVQVFTGFGLYAAMTDWWLPDLFAWVPGLLGGDFAVRNIHNAAMWFFVVFTIIHVYLVLFHDYVEGRGEVSSMTGGWKFIEEEEFHQEEKEKEEFEKTHIKEEKIPKIEKSMPRREKTE